MDEHRQRATDQGFLCVIALRAGQFWDFVDKRNIDKFVVSAIVLFGTIKITEWAIHFVDLHPDKPGLEVAAIIGAVLVPWSALQGAAIKFFFDSRDKP